MRTHIRKLRYTHAVTPHLPTVQPVHGRHCVCHRCQPGALGRFPEDRTNRR